MSDQPGPQTPPASARPGSRRQLIRLLGRLDNWQPDQRRFSLALEDGLEAVGVLAESCAADAAAMIGKRVAVSGSGVWSPEGEFQRVEATHLTDGSGESSFWSRLPMAPAELSPLPVEAPTPPLEGLPVFPDMDQDPLTDAEVLQRLREMD